MRSRQMMPHRNMKQIIGIVILLILGITLARADWLFLNFGSSAGSGVAACSNSLDFTQSCNSQYAGAIL
jgi:hypothetical protein